VLVHAWLTSSWQIGRSIQSEEWVISHSYAMGSYIELIMFIVCCSKSELGIEM
jgi:hypothetical protein